MAPRNFRVPDKIVKSATKLTMECIVDSHLVENGFWITYVMIVIFYGFTVGFFINFIFIDVIINQNENSFKLLELESCEFIV